MLKRILKGIVYIFAAFGVFGLLSLAYAFLTPCGGPSIDCKGPYRIMQEEISNTRALAQMRQDSGKSLDGFCEDWISTRYFNRIPNSFIVECKDTENSYTVMGRDSKDSNRSGFCADGTGNTTSTRLTTQDGIECK